MGNPRYFNSALYDELKKIIGPGYQPAIGRRVAEVVPEVLVDALVLDIDEVTPRATLIGDLNAESIDALDITFRLERGLGLRINRSEMGNLLIPEGENPENFRESTVLDLTKFAYDKVAEGR